MMKGAPKPEDLLKSQYGVSNEKAAKSLEDDTLSSDARLWTQVMRNLGKDIYKNSSVSLTGLALSAFSKDSDSSSIPSGDVLAFSCGHAFPAANFESRVLIEFKERVQNFPIPIPQTLLQLQTCYKKLSSFPTGCPYCVFQHLRQLQLQECPDTPIKPWIQ